MIDADSLPILDIPGEADNDNLDCQRAKRQFIAECTDEILMNPDYPPSGNEDELFDCINDKLSAVGCL